MGLRTKFDGSSAASRWLHILEGKLWHLLSPGTWLRQADACLEDQGASWADRTPEVSRILPDGNIETTTV